MNICNWTEHACGIYSDNITLKRINNNSLNLIKVKSPCKKYVFIIQLFFQKQTIMQVVHSWKSHPTIQDSIFMKSPLYNKKLNGKTFNNNIFTILKFLLQWF